MKTFRSSTYFKAALIGLAIAIAGALDPMLGEEPIADAIVYPLIAILIVLAADAVKMVAGTIRAARRQNRRRNPIADQPARRPRATVTRICRDD